MIRGRKPKPTAEKAAAGNPGKRPLNLGELTQAVKAPPRPRDLTPAARKHWARYVKLFLRRGILREEDGPQLANLCEAIATLSEARAALAKLPADTRLLVKAGAGIQVNPLLYIIRDQVQTINRIGAEFGLSPSARTRLTYDEGTVTASGADSLENLIGGGAEPEPEFRVQ